MATKKEVAKTKPAGQMVLHDYGDDANVGFDDTTQEDFAIPFLTVLQALSPQVTGDGREILEGAKPGMLMNTVSEELYEELIFVPCVRQHVFVEWVPRKQGGGFVGIHQPDSEIVVKAKSEAEKFGKYKTEGGNELQETFYWYCYRLDSVEDTEAGEPFVLAFTSTKIKKYKKHMTSMRKVKGRPPMYAHRVRIRGCDDSSPDGPFKNFEMSPALGSIADSLILPCLKDGSPNPLLATGRDLLIQVRGGDVRPAHESTTAGAGGEGTEETPF